MKDDVQSLTHSKWRCKYHIVFAPKYRRQIIYGKIKADVGKVLRELSERKSNAGSADSLNTYNSINQSTSFTAIFATQTDIAVFFI